MDALRNELLQLLRGGQAYEPFESVVSAFSADERGLAPYGAERSAWQIVEHMRLSQRDILDFSQNENGAYCNKVWPGEYWVVDPVPSEGEWDRAVEQIKAGVDEFDRLLEEKAHDLVVPFPWAEGQNLLREILVAADHSTYHIGQLVELKRWIDSTARL
jgi:hypothetical protein